MKEKYGKCKDNITLKAIILSSLVFIFVTIIEWIVDYHGWKLYIHIIFIVLRFWSNNGFQLAFGYIALCLVVPTISFSHKVVEYFYMKKHAHVFISFSTLFLLISVIASLLEPDLSSIENHALEYGYWPILEKVMYVVSGICITVTFMYVSVFSFSLMDMLKYKSMSIDKYLENTSS